MSFASSSIAVDKDKSIIIGFIRMYSLNYLVDEVAAPESKYALRINLGIKYVIEGIYFSI